MAELFESAVVPSLAALNRPGWAQVAAASYGWGYDGKSLPLVDRVVRTVIKVDLMYF